MFGVVAPVPQQRVQRTAGRGRPSRGLELRRVLAGAAADVGRQEQMAGRLQDDRQLGPELLPTALALAPDVVAAGVVGLVAGRVDGPTRFGRDQAALFSVGNGLAEQGIDPFFSRRRWAAFWRVEWSGTLVRPKA